MLFGSPKQIKNHSKTKQQDNDREKNNIIFGIIFLGKDFFLFSRSSM